MLQGDTDDIFIAVPMIEIMDESLDGTETIKKQDDCETVSADTKIEEGSTCLVCLDSLRTLDTTVMECCGQPIHAVCVSKWLSHVPLCPFCRNGVSQITFQGSIIPFDNKIHSNADSSKSALNFDMDCLKKSDPNESTSRHGRIRNATEIKRKRQDNSAEKMIKRRAKHAADSGASVGAIVRVGNDARDVQEPRSTIGVIFDISDAGGALVCTEWGVVVHGSRRKDHWVSSDRYEVVARSDEDDTAVITPGLAKVREEIRSDKFDRSEKAGVTLQECHKRFVGSSPVRATVGCRCGMGSNGKKSCVAGCGCIKKKVACTSKCACNGNCKTNQFNNRK